MGYHELGKDDAEFLDDLIGDTDPKTPSGERRDAVVRELEVIWQSTHADRTRVGRVLWWAVQRAVLDRITKIDRSEHVAVVAPFKTGSIPKRYAFRPVNPTTGKVRGYIQAIFIDRPWDEYLARLAQMERDHAGVGANLETWRRIAALRPKYPDTKTPREACKREGIDPDVLLVFAT